jgi:hypothetical protein
MFTKTAEYYDLVYSFKKLCRRSREDPRLESHPLALYTTQEMLKFFERAGLDARFGAEGLFGRGFYIARPKAQSG